MAISEIENERANVGYEDYLFYPFYLWKKEFGSLKVPTSAKELGITTMKVILLVVTVQLILFPLIIGFICREVRNGLEKVSKSVPPSAGFEEHLLQLVYLWKKEWAFLKTPKSIKELATTILKVIRLSVVIPVVVWSGIIGFVCREIRSLTR